MIQQHQHHLAWIASALFVLVGSALFAPTAPQPPERPAAFSVHALVSGELNPYYVRPEGD